MKRTLALWRAGVVSAALCVTLGVAPLPAFAWQAEAEQDTYDEAPAAVSPEATSELPALGDGAVAQEPAGVDPVDPTDVTPVEEVDPNAIPAGEAVPADEQDDAALPDGQAMPEEPAAGRLDVNADPAVQGWVNEGDATYYYQDGVPLTGEQCLTREDGSSQAWYWFDEQGKLARGIDLYIPAGEGGKWVRLDATGAMMTGEHFANDPAAGHVGWYHFDEETRAMSMGITTLPAGKTVYYDASTGVMRFGEVYVPGTAEGWYLFEQGTGAMVRGWRYLPTSGGKWVYYDAENGRMSQGERYVTDGENGWCYFNPVTGATTFGWSYHSDEWHYYNPANGRAFVGEHYITDGENGWCCFSEDRGVLQRGFTYLPQHDKWVYYDAATGRMRFGEQYIDGGWYLLDPTTGARATGWRYMPSNGGKWVYYIPETGRMATGETHVTIGIEGWYYFDVFTGAMQRGWRYLGTESAGKWVYYDPATGRMCTGEHFVTEGENGWCLFNDVSGAVQMGIRYLPDLDKVVYYDNNNGRMRFGWQQVGGIMLHFDEVTGAMQADGFSLLARAAQVEGLPTVDAEIASLLAEGARVRVLGDSICGGWGVASKIVYGERVVADDGTRTWYEPSSAVPTWVNALRSYLAERKGSLFNAAVPGKGYDWFDGLGETLPDGGEANYDLTFVALGTNDWAKEPEDLATYATSVLEKALASSGKVLAVLPAPVKTSAEGHQGSYGVHQTLLDTCEKLGVQAIDLFTNFYSCATAAGLATPELYADGVHLTVAGQAVYWGLVSKSLGIDQTAPADQTVPEDQTAPVGGLQDD